MYYATYRVFIRSEIACFQDKDARDAWVKHRDPMSLAFHVDPRYAIPRMRITDKRFIKRIEEQHKIRCFPDEYDPNIEWVVFDF